MSREEPRADCVEVLFGRRYAVSASAEVALEDYARALTGATAAEALGDGEKPERLRGVHLCALSTPPAAGMQEDIEAFAGELADRASVGLGWS